MVPRSLRWWFVVHFVADILFAVPLFLAPAATLTYFGWKAVDPATTRGVAAALFGIGIQSLIGRNESAETFRAMLNLKVIWSAAAAIGLLWTQLEGGPPLGWVAFGIFVAFNGVWVRYRLLLAGRLLGGAAVR